MSDGAWAWTLEQIPDLICDDDRNTAGAGSVFDGEQNEWRRGDRSPKTRLVRESHVEGVSDCKMIELNRSELEMRCGTQASEQLATTALRSLAA